ncbi:MAG: SDR family NAD(P)-dependent oxidoreductase [Candidatus Nanopelagicales bacterium]
MRIQDSVVAVTGGASGLGAAVVRRAMAQGARGVAILDVNDALGKDLAKELGSSAMFAHCDVRNGDDVSSAISQIESTFGALHLAVACAGIGWAERTLAKDGSPADLDAYRRVIEINLIGSFDFARQAASLMSRNEPGESGERGAIVMTASLAAYDGQVGQVAYSASKGGVVGMTLPMSRDLAPVGVRVMTIAPGLMDTPIYDAVGGQELKEHLIKTTVFPKRLGTADEFAHLVQSIAENAYLNGETIRLDAATRLPPR